MKKALSFLLAITLAVTTLTGMNIVAYTDDNVVISNSSSSNKPLLASDLPEELTNDNYIYDGEINIGDNILVQMQDSGEKHIFKFVPENDVKAEFYSTNDVDIDTYATVYDSEGCKLVDDDDSGFNLNFSVTYDFYAGETYYFVTRLWGSGVYDYYVNLMADNFDSFELNCPSGFEFYENCGGYWEDEYFNYNIDFHSDDSITLNYNDGTPSTTYYYFYEYTFVNENDENDKIRVKVNHNQYDEHWFLGGEYYFTVKYKNYEQQVPVSIVENPVESISFEPKTKPFVYEGYDSTIENFEDGQHCLFDYDPIKLGDVIVVNYKDSTTDRFTCVGYYDDYDYYPIMENENGDRIDGDMIGFWDNQYDEPWQIGGENNYYYIECFGYKEIVDIDVLENPVDSVEFNNVDNVAITPDSYYLDAFADYDEDGNPFVNFKPYYHREYIISCFDENSQIIVNYKNGESKNFDFNFVEGENVFEPYYTSYFMAQDGEKIRLNKFFGEINDNDGELQFDITVFGKTLELDATFVEDDVDYIEYTPANPVEFMEGDDYYYYVREGDVVTINYTDGTSKTYTAVYDELFGETAFYDENGELCPEYRIIDTKEIVPWEVGKDNYLFFVIGSDYCKIPVEIIANPVDYIELSFDEPIEIFENDNGYWEDDFFYYNMPDISSGILTVYYTDGTSKDFEHQVIYNENTDSYYSGFVAEDGEIISDDEWQFSNRQWDDHWQVGSDNYFYIEYKNRECAVQVTIVESPVDYLEYTPVNPIERYEHTLGEWYEDYNDESFFYYYIPWYSEGDVLSIYYTDGTSKDFEYKYVSSDDEYNFVAEDGEIIDTDELNFYDNQWSNHWQLGSDNYYYLRYKGKQCYVPVTIVTHSHTYEMFGENVDGYCVFRCDECGDEQYYSQEELLDMWSSDLANQQQNEDNYMFDVVNDDIINAKDYAAILTGNFYMF